MEGEFVSTYNLKVVRKTVVNGLVVDDEVLQEKEFTVDYSDFWKFFFSLLEKLEERVQERVQEEKKKGTHNRITNTLNMMKKGYIVQNNIVYKIVPTEVPVIVMLAYDLKNHTLWLEHVSGDEKYIPKDLMDMYEEHPEIRKVAEMIAFLDEKADEVARRINGNYEEEKKEREGVVKGMVI